ncbi:MAG: hypothetical protein M9885_00830 [Burkholderiaceae bacterium]|nr:hypothetical protein [Burkholderiaceae bacterium]
MKDVEFFTVDAVPIDRELQDAGSTGPELAQLAASYASSPRAIVFRDPSSDWRLFVVMLPLASRLSLMTNPIFAHLTRAWGLNVRFVGVDRDQLVYDFRALLSDRTLRLLVDVLARSDVAPGAARPADDALDLLFSSLADEMLTTLDRRRDDWGRHLDREHRIEAHAPGSLFDRAGRHPDFLARLRAALRDEIVDVDFYGRALRSIDLREDAIDARVRAVLESALDPITLAKLRKTGAGLHLGCYNWLRIDPRHAAPRAHVLASLPSFANFFADALVPIDACGRHRDAVDDDEAWHDGPVESATPARGNLLGSATPRPARATFELRPIAARERSAHSLYWGAALKRAIDAGQDRAAIEAIAQRFAVADNVVRRIWRERPAGLGQPPAWQLGEVLRRLQSAGERAWPADDAHWHALLASAVPAEAA